MNILRRHSDREKHGTRHLSASEMAKLYQNYHLQLQESYYDHAANQRICEEGMTEIRNVHICKKHSSFIMNYVTLVREIYSHTHYNTYELMFDEESRLKIRQTYWEQVETLFDRIVEAMELIWHDISSPERLAILMSYATLFSLYKEVADVKIIEYCYHSACEALHHTHKKNAGQKEHIREYYDSIHAIYILRDQLGKGKQRQPRKSSFPELDMTVPLGLPVEETHYKAEKPVEDSEHYYGDSIDMSGDPGEMFGPIVETEKESERHRTSLGFEFDFWIENVTEEIITEALAELAPVADDVQLYQAESDECMDQEPIEIHIDTSLYDAAPGCSDGEKMHHDSYYGEEPSPSESLPRSRRSTLPNLGIAPFLRTHGAQSNTDMMRRLSLKPDSEEEESMDTEETPILPPFDPLKMYNEKLGGARKVPAAEVPIIAIGDVVHTYRRRGLFDTPTRSGVEKKRISESESEARESKGARTSESENIDIPGSECATPMNTPFESELKNPQTREIHSGVFEGICVPRKECETPQNTPMPGNLWEKMVDDESSQQLHKALEEKIIRAVINETAVSPQTPRSGADDAFII